MNCAIVKQFAHVIVGEMKAAASAQAPMAPKAEDKKVEDTKAEDKMAPTSDDDSQSDTPKPGEGRYKLFKCPSKRSPTKKAVKKAPAKKADKKAPAKKPSTYTSVCVNDLVAAGRLPKDFVSSTRKAEASVNDLIAAGHCPKELTRTIFKDRAIQYDADGTAQVTKKRMLMVKSSENVDHDKTPRRVVQAPRKAMIPGVDYSRTTTDVRGAMSGFVFNPTAT